MTQRSTALAAAEPPAPGTVTAIDRALAVTLVAWFVFVLWGGLGGAFVAAPDAVARPVLIPLAVPVVVFLAFYAGSRTFRTYVLSLDVRLLTLFQTWRVLGFGFLLLYAHDVLPAVFAWPAGLGDVAIGITAVWVVRTLYRNPEFAGSGRFQLWNGLGLLDFVVAALTATLADGALPALVDGAVTSAPMQVWPLSVFPTFLVPVFICLHLVVLFQARARVRAGGPVPAAAH
jgi:hypothetical protein